MVKSSSTGTPISLATSSFSILFQPTITSARRTNKSTPSPTSRKSTSSNDSISESRLFVDEDSSDKNKVELDKINNLETCNINSVENGFDVDSENDDSLEKPAKNINDSVKVNDEQFYYDEIEIGTITSETTTCIIKAEQIIEKRVFYLQSNGRATFIRFPNLEEHS
ncbi:unnamed protein product [Rotaria sordida]|uniref:Uncharacterized protein n=1 Tax=Rotaria sordida TaxID=392033 RepID=A0A815HFF7_9BILA|nr:unnamed protein product [Rotaria sordida]CAF1602085.1 unnamed protein product [Rotaria sordida]